MTTLGWRVKGEQEAKDNLEKDCCKRTGQGTMEVIKYDSNSKEHPAVLNI